VQWVSSPSPVGGVDYPRTYQEFRQWFPDDTACVEYLGRVRFGIDDGPGTRKLVTFAFATIVEGSTVRTDGARMLRRLAALGYIHEYAFRFNRSNARARGMLSPSAAASCRHRPAPTARALQPVR
jgi:hypothetical protein